MQLKRFIGQLLPEGLEDHYDLIVTEASDERFLLHLDEKNIKPHYLSKEVEITSKVFFLELSEILT